MHVARPAAVGSAPRARPCRSHGCSLRGPRASAPTRWPRSSARASRRLTTCSSACATRASPCIIPAASIGWRRPSARWSRAPPSPADELTTSRAWSTSCSRAPTSAPTWASCAPASCTSSLERGCRACPSCPGWAREIADNAHALALGKVVLAMAAARGRRALPAGRPAALQRPHDHRARRPARRAARGPPPRLRGRAEEFGEDFCCIAAPVLDAAGASSRRSGSRCRAGPSTRSTRRSRRRSSASPWPPARARARVPRAAQRLRHRPIPGIFRNPPVLDPPADAGLAWTRGTTVP